MLPVSDPIYETQGYPGNAADAEFRVASHIGSIHISSCCFYTNQPVSKLNPLRLHCNENLCLFPIPGFPDSPWTPSLSIHSIHPQAAINGFDPIDLSIVHRHFTSQSQGQTLSGSSQQLTGTDTFSFD